MLSVNEALTFIHYQRLREISFFWNLLESVRVPQLWRHQKRKCEEQCISYVTSIRDFWVCGTFCLECRTRQSVVVDIRLCLSNRPPTFENVILVPPSLPTPWFLVLGERVSLCHFSLEQRTTLTTDTSNIEKTLSTSSSLV